MSEIKPMEYKEGCAKHVLHSGTIFGIQFSVESLGTHPVAYIYVPKCVYETYYNELDGCVPGGITYKGEEKFGWDYAHAKDFVYGAKKDGKKWTTDEIISDAKEIIKFYVRLREAKDESILKHVDALEYPTYILIHIKQGSSKKNIDNDENSL